MTLCSLWCFVCRKKRTRKLVAACVWHPEKTTFSAFITSKLCTLREIITVLSFEGIKNSHFDNFMVSLNNI